MPGNSISFWEKLKWQRVPASSISFKNLNRETRFLFLYACFYIVLGIGIGRLILVYPLPLFEAKDFIQDFWYAVIFKFIFLFILPALVYFGPWGYSKNELLYGLQIKPSSVVKGLIWILIGFSLNLGHIPKVVGSIHFFDDAPLRLTVGILLPLLIAGIPEELFFRGFLQTRLEKLWNGPLAILVSGILFTAWHLPSRYFLSNGVEGHAGDFTSILLGTGIPVLLVSFFFGWHWARYRNLPLLILIHWAIDILPSVSSFFHIVK